MFTRKLYKSIFLLVTLLMCTFPIVGMAQATFEGMVRVADWTDFENQSDEMPAVVWGACDTDQADRVGIIVEFDDGTLGSATYSGVSTHWNSYWSPGIDADAATGFFTACTGLHHLHNNGSNLPMAWLSCSMPFSNNFDLDYSEQNGSHFRASTQGWVSARVQTYCGDGEESTYSVGGTVSGLTGTGLALQNNGGDTLAVAAAATAFTFGTELLDLAVYAVTVSAQPTGQTCSVTNDSGAIAAADVTDVAVDCVDNVIPPAIPVPTLSQWALIMLSMFLGLMVFANRRRLF